MLFSDEAEQIYKRDGLDAFAANEDAARKQPLMGGPLRTFWPHYSDCNRHSRRAPAHSHGARYGALRTGSRAGHQNPASLGCAHR